MTGNKKAAVMLFLPLAVGFVILAIIINDMKHPVVHKESCKLVGKGASIQQFKENARSLLKESDNIQNDIALRCNDLGDVIVNQMVPMPLTPGQTIEMTTRSYQYLPDRYYLFLHVVKTSAEEKHPERQPH